MLSWGKKARAIIPEKAGIRENIIMRTEVIRSKSAMLLG